LEHVFPYSLYSEKDLQDKFDDSKKDLEWFFNTKALSSFISDEIIKHNLLYKAYLDSIVLNESENNFLNVFNG